MAMGVARQLRCREARGVLNVMYVSWLYPARGFMWWWQPVSHHSWNAPALPLLSRDDLLNEKVALGSEGYRIPPRKIYTKDAGAVQQAFKIRTMFSRFTKRAQRNCDMKSIS
jgi:hypothetical protein